MTSSTAESLGFFREFLSDPFRVAAIAPSGRALAKLITSEIVPGRGQIIELGVGTGVFTRALIERGVSEKDLILVERGADFAARLRLRFPAAQVLCMDAAELSTLPSPGADTAAAVVSGLPLLSMKPEAVIAILDGAFAQMAETGAFYQFTYGPRCPVPRKILGDLHLEARRIGHTWRNLPPATVYRISRPSSLR